MKASPNPSEGRDTQTSSPVASPPPGEGRVQAGGGCSMFKPIAHFRSPFTSKFGIPKQAGLVENLKGEIVFEPEYRHADALRGLDEFDFIWLIWGFSANPHAGSSLVVRPPLLGGNQKMGVFATRSPFRPNPIGLSSVRLTGIDMQRSDGPVLTVAGADLLDGTPIYDIKPYLVYTDSHPEARSGFVDTHQAQPLKVVFPDDVADTFSGEQIEMLTGILSLDPRPRYQHDSQRIYGMPFAGRDIKFRVENGTCYVLRTEKR